MKHENPKHRQARDLYLQSDLTRAQIADILSIDRKTLYLWIRNNQWDKMKATASQAPDIIKQDVYNHISAINQNIYDREDCLPTMQEVEMLRELMVMTKAIDSVHIGGYIQSFQDLALFIIRSDREFGLKVKAYADKFLQSTLFNKGKHINMKQLHELEEKDFTSETFREVMDVIEQENDQETAGKTTAKDTIENNTTPPENNNANTPPADPSGNNEKLGNNNIIPFKPNTDKPLNENDNMNKDEKFPKPGFNTDGKNNPKPPSDNDQEDNITPQKE
jgi:predicted DNA-binding protein YlxM (UPF0122 family)